MLSKQATEEYQMIYKKFFGTEISYAEALEQGEKLIKLFKIVYRPISKAWISELNNKNHGS